MRNRPPLTGVYCLWRCLCGSQIITSGEEGAAVYCLEIGDKAGRIGTVGQTEHEAPTVWA